jgi:regulator of RNase E activity RraA
MYKIFDRRSTISPAVLNGYKSITPSALGHQIDGCAMDSNLRPLQQGVCLLGTAVTVQTMGRDSVVCHKVIDFIQPGDVIVVDRNGDLKYASWGEMTTLAAQMAGAAGIIVDGPVTDVQALRQQPLPIFCRRTAVLTTQFLGCGGAINIPVVCGGVVVKPGDLIFGDDNGILVIDPSDAERLLELAIVEEKEDQEWRNGLIEGKRPSQMAPLDQMIEEANKRYSNRN